MQMSWFQALSVEVGDDLLVSYALSLDGHISAGWYRMGPLLFLQEVGKGERVKGISYFKL